MSTRFIAALAIAGFGTALFAGCSGNTNNLVGTSPAPDSIVVATEVPFAVEFAPAAGTASATATFNNSSMTTGTTGNVYSYTLAPNMYTISGQMSLPGSVIVDLEYKAPANCNGPPCLGGVVSGSVGSTITCGGTTCDPTVAQQTVNPCDVVYTIFGTSGVPIATPVEFQMQFVVNGSIAATAACP